MSWKVIAGVVVAYLALKPKRSAAPSDNSTLGPTQIQRNPWDYNPDGAQYTPGYYVNANP